MTRTAMGTWLTVGLTLAHLVAVAAFLGDRNGLRLTHDLAGWAASIAGVVGTVAAARAFSEGDHLRRVWTLFAIAASLLLAGTALRSYWTHAAPFTDLVQSPLIWPRMVVVGGANAALIWGLILMASTYARSGLEVPRSHRFFTLWVALSAVALVLMLRQLRFDLGRFVGPAEAASALTSIFSTVADTANIVLIAPILRIAYLMRGGRLGRVWLAVGLSGAVWLLYDCREWIAPWLPAEPAQSLELLRALRTPGLALVGLAGLMQQDAVK